MFHTPKTIGERTRLKMTPLLRGLSWGSLALQAGSSIFSIVGYVTLTQAGYVDGWILLVLPIVMWVLSIVARLGFRYLPLDMWRMPVDVRKGMVVCQGWDLAGGAAGLGLAALPPGGQDRPGRAGLEGRTAGAESGTGVSRQA